MLNTINAKPYGKYTNSKEPHFGNGALMAVNGFATKGFQFLQNYPVAEIVGVDAATMIAPRTAVDYQQNPVYGAETFVREVAAMLPNPFLPGIVSCVMLKNKGFQGLYANSNSLNIMHQTWKSANDNVPRAANDNQARVSRFWNKYLGEAAGEVGNNPAVKLAEADRKVIAQTLTDASFAEGKTSNELFKKAVKQLTEATGASESFTVKIGGHVHKTDSRTMLYDGVQAVKKIFVPTETPEKVAAKIEDLTKFSKKRALWAVIPSIALGASLQKLITLGSRVVTGKDGFTGYKNFETKNIDEKAQKRKNQGLWWQKGLVMAGMAGMVLATTGAFGPNGLKKGVSHFLKNFEVKGKFAHIDIMRVVYGGILMGRFATARDKTELKTHAYRDYAGFMNWLVLGPFVAKGFATIFAPKLLNGLNNVKNAKGFQKVRNWLNDVSLKAPDEMLAMAKGSRTTQAKYNIARGAGLAWSLFALGIGTPYLINKYVIDKALPSQKLKPGLKANDINTAQSLPGRTSFDAFLKNAKPSFNAVRAKLNGA